MKKCILLFLLLSAAKVHSQDSSIARIDSINFKLSGKGWKLTGKYPTGGQFSFQNKKDNLGISLSARDKTKFEFYDSKLTDSELVYTFYKWDFDYWKSNPKYEVSEIKKDELKKYFIWKVKFEKGSNYFLSGIKDNFLIGLGFPQQKKAIDSITQIELLENTFLTATVGPIPTGIYTKIIVE